MIKEIKYTSANLFDIKNLRHTIYCQIEECNIQKKEYWMVKSKNYTRLLAH